MSKFKVGDKVKVINKFDDDYCGWTQDMDSTVGMNGVVSRAFSHPPRCTVRLSDSMQWAYLDSVLELVEDAVNVPAKSSKMTIEKVGDVCKLVVEGSLTREQIGNILEVVYG